MGWDLITPPATEVITLAQAKTHLRVDTTADDALITALIIAARQRYEGPEGVYGIAFLTQTWDYWADSFPPAGIEITFGPIQSITAINYTGTSGAAVLPPASYQADFHSKPARILPAGGTSWPATATGAINAVNLRLVVGYGATADKVPALAVQTMLVAIGYWYANRGGYGSTDFPIWIDRLGLGLKRNWMM